MTPPTRKIPLPTELRYGPALEIAALINDTAKGVPVELDLGRLTLDAATTSMIAGHLVGVAASRRSPLHVTNRKMSKEFLRQLQGFGLHAFLRFGIEGGSRKTKSWSAMDTALRQQPEIAGKDWFVIPDLVTYASGLRRKAAFDESLRKLLEDSLLVPSDDLNPPLELGLFSMLREAVLNVYHHSSKKPLFEDKEVCSALQIRWVERDTLPAPAFDGSTTPQTRGLWGFLEGLRDSSHTGVLEIVVADNGNGIAARHALASDIYVANFSQERDVSAMRSTAA
jgi:hypothetical protein